MAASLKVEYLICPADDHYIFADGTSKLLMNNTPAGGYAMPKLTTRDRWPKKPTKFQRAFANIFDYPSCYNSIKTTLHGDTIVMRWAAKPPVWRHHNFSYYGQTPCRHPRKRQIVLKTGDEINIGDMVNNFRVEKVLSNGNIKASFPWMDGSGYDSYTMNPGLVLTYLSLMTPKRLFDPFIPAFWTFLKAIVKFKRLAARARDKANAPDGPAFKRVRREVVEEGRMRA
jgi:hypothetical protein